MTLIAHLNWRIIGYGGSFPREIWKFKCSLQEAAVLQRHGGPATMSLKLVLNTSLNASVSCSLIPSVWISLTETAGCCFICAATNFPHTQWCAWNRFQLFLSFSVEAQWDDLMPGVMFSGSPSICPLHSYEDDFSQEYLWGISSNLAQMSNLDPRIYLLHLGDQRSSSVRV